MLEIEYVKDVMYTNSDQTCIHATVKFKQFKDEVPYAAMPNDVSDDGRKFFADLKAEVYGAVKPYVPPPPQEKANATSQPQST